MISGDPRSSSPRSVLALWYDVPRSSVCAGARDIGHLWRGALCAHAYGGPASRLLAQTPIGPSTACPRSGCVRTETANTADSRKSRCRELDPRHRTPDPAPTPPSTRAHPLHPHAVPSTLRARPYLGRCTPRAERQTAGVQAFPSSPRTTSSLPHDLLLNTQHDHPHAQHFSPYGRACVSTRRTHTASRVVPQPLGLTTPRSFARRRSQTGSSSSGGDGCACAGCSQHNPDTARSANNASAGHATRDVRPRLYDSVDRGLRA
ncbi:hypothetical protein B0H10DRAFT_607756 [Mycena sp. CBHHK59/15]|nr:hypothetical protein B0H10DRAFT_607756 [Mycena sp. CBHHK59/15]